MARLGASRPRFAGCTTQRHISPLQDLQEHWEGPLAENNNYTREPEQITNNWDPTLFVLPINKDSLLGHLAGKAILAQHEPAARLEPVLDQPQ